jgi:hypothetical protein
MSDFSKLDLVHATLSALRDGYRPSILSPVKTHDVKRQWHCCHITCDNLADFVLHSDNHFEDYTHMCTDHVAHYQEDYDHKTPITRPERGET